MILSVIQNGALYSPASWFRDDDSGDGNTSAQDDADADGNDGAPTDAEGNETAENASTEQEHNETDGTDESNASENGTNLEDEDESTRPEAETIEDADAVETEHEAIRHAASVEIRGTVTNTSSNAIDQVSVEVVLYSADGGELFREVDGTVGLVEWDTWDFSIKAEGTEYVERVEWYDLAVTAEQHQGE